MLNQKALLYVWLVMIYQLLHLMQNRVACIGEDTFHIHESNDIMDIETSLKKYTAKNEIGNTLGGIMLEYAFMQRALIGGLLVSIIAPLWEPL